MSRKTFVTHFEEKKIITIEDGLIKEPETNSKHKNVMRIKNIDSLITSDDQTCFSVLAYLGEKSWGYRFDSKEERDNFFDTVVSAMGD